MRRSSSSPGNLHRQGRKTAKPTSPSEIVRGFAVNALAVGFALVCVCNAQAIGGAAAAALPSGTLDWLLAAVATSSSESAAIAAAAAKASEDGHVGGGYASLLKVGARVSSSLRERSSAAAAAAAAAASEQESNASGWDYQQGGGEWSVGASSWRGDSEGSSDVGVLLGALAALLVCLVGIRQSILCEYADDVKQSRR